MENATYRKTLELSQKECTQTIEEANVIVINTCAYTTDQEEKSLLTIKKFQEQFPDKKVIVGGCLTKINSNKLSEIYQGETFQPGNIPICCRSS